MKKTLIAAFAAPALSGALLGGLVVLRRRKQAGKTL